jgi:hypothetical protein
MKYVVHYIFKAYTYPTINGYIFDIRCHVHYTQFQLLIVVQMAALRGDIRFWYLKQFFLVYLWDISSTEWIICL